MSSEPVVVIGDGWSALGAVGFLVLAQRQVVWIAGTGTRILPPLASLEWGPGVKAWAELASKLGVECGECHQGHFLREFRNKAFRAPVPEKVLWTPESRLA